MNLSFPAEVSHAAFTDALSENPASLCVGKMDFARNLSGCGRNQVESFLDFVGEVRLPGNQERIRRLREARAGLIEAVSAPNASRRQPHERLAAAMIGRPGRQQERGLWMTSSV